MTRAELEKKNKELQNELENLESAYAQLDSCYAEQENKLADLEYENSFAVQFDMGDFINYLRKNGLWTAEHDTAMWEFLMFYSDVPKEDINASYS